MIEWANGKINELIDLVRGATVLGAIAMVVYTYIRTRQIVAVLVAAITAGVVLWVVNAPEWWQARISEESGAPALVVVDAPPAGPEPVRLVDLPWESA